MSADPDLDARAWRDYLARLPVCHYCGERVDGVPQRPGTPAVCDECLCELRSGKFAHDPVHFFGGRRGARPNDDEASPWQANALRDWEDSEE